MRPLVYGNNTEFQSNSLVPEASARLRLQIRLKFQSWHLSQGSVPALSAALVLASASAFVLDESPEVFGNVPGSVLCAFEKIRFLMYFFLMIVSR